MSFLFIDFAQTPLPKSNGKKRPLPDLPPQEILKKARTDEPSKVQEEGTEEMEMEDSFAPGDDADYYVEEDDEGRFFGGGLTTEQKQILNIFDNVPVDKVSEEQGGDFRTRLSCSNDN